MTRTVTGALQGRASSVASLLLASFICIAPAWAADGFDSCIDQFANGGPPIILKESLTRQARPLCFQAFAVLHSGATRTPLWSAEHLTAARVAAAAELKRKGAFHEERRLPAGEAETLADYQGYGDRWDRGHMSPNKDMPTPSAQAESFSLANMVPQNKNINENLWEGIETAVRSLATADGEVYVVTGPIFEGANLETLNGRVFVPTSVFKAVYDPARRKAGAYIAPNAEGASGMAYQTVSVAELEQRIGINLFPSLSAAMKAEKLDLPAPTPHAKSKNRRSRTNDW